MLDDQKCYDQNLFYILSLILESLYYYIGSLIDSIYVINLDIEDILLYLW